MDERRARRQRLLRGQHRRQLLVLDLDQLDRLARGLEIDRGDSRDRLADIAHLAAGQRRLVLDERAQMMLAEIGAGDDRLDAGQRQRRRDVVGEDAGMRIGAARIAPCSMQRGNRSSMKCAWPVSFSRVSSRGMPAPTGLA